MEEVVDVLYEKILQGPGNKEIRKRHLKVVVLDLYVNWLSDPELYTGYYRQVSHYKAKSRYNKLQISKLVIQVIDALVEHGYVDHKKGFYDYSSRTSRMRGKKKLFELIKRPTTSLSNRRIKVPYIFPITGTFFHDDDGS